MTLRAKRPVIVINGRFLTRRVTGVERYAREVLARLPDALDAQLAVVVPPNLVFSPKRALAVEPDGAWSGGKGHRWEQLTLPRLLRATGANLLVSPCNHGPIRGGTPQLVVMHDLLTLRFPRLFPRRYVEWNRVSSRALARRSRRVITVSERSRNEIVELLGVGADRVDIVPAGVGPPFTEVPLDDLGDRLGTYCVFVGAQDSWKNLRFLLSFWDRAWKELGLELHVVRRRTPAASGDRVDLDRPGVVIHDDPDDATLAGLYAEALCLLWPSLHEGFGIPLLEAGATGTPFLGAGVGAAPEVAAEPDQILPLEPERWTARLEQWTSFDITSLRARSAEKARSFTWEQTAARVARSIERCLA